MRNGTKTLVYDLMQQQKKLYNLFRVRGALISTMVFGEDFGIMLASVFGHYFGYYGIPKLAIAIMTCLAILLCFFPETPVFLMKQGKISVSKLTNDSFA